MMSSMYVMSEICIAVTIADLSFELPMSIPRYVVYLPVGSSSYQSSRFMSIIEPYSDRKWHSYSYAKMSGSGHNDFNLDTSTSNPSEIASCMVVCWTYHSGFIMAF